MKAIDIIMIPVNDQAKAKAFYLQLGFEILMEADDAHGGTWLQMQLPGGPTTISLSSFQGIICQTDDIAQEVKALAEKGIQVGKIDPTPWGKFAWLKDLDGNSLCLHEKP
jgi:catechol 2,3-dioxygenase-like lactoylglutathione lyase family enzyme